MIVALTHRSLGKTTRSVFALVFALLLIAMQQEAGWHALSHLPTSLGEPARQAIHLPGEPCLECSLLASTTDFIPSAAPPLLLMADAVDAHAAVHVAGLDRTRLHYQSRAPPSLA